MLVVHDLSFTLSWKPVDQEQGRKCGDMTRLKNAVTRITNISYMPRLTMV